MANLKDLPELSLLMCVRARVRDTEVRDYISVGDYTCIHYSNCQGFVCIILLLLIQIN